jgi:hypothetical protein
MLKKTLGYEVYLGNYGWNQGPVYDGMAAGTVGCSVRIEAVKVYGLPAGWQYRAHVQRNGWLDWVNEGGVAGTTGQALRLEALEFRSTDTSNLTRIYGRGHVQHVGWQPMAELGMIGTTGQSLRLEALQLWLVVPVGSFTPEVVGALKTSLAGKLGAGGLALTAADSAGGPPPIAAIDLVKDAAWCLASLGWVGTACAETGGFGCFAGGGAAIGLCAAATQKGTQFFAQQPGGRTLPWVLASLSLQHHASGGDNDDDEHDDEQRRHRS